MKYWKGTLGDYVVQADTHGEAVAAIDRRILAGIVPILDVEEVDMEPSEAEDYGTLGEPEGPWVGVEDYAAHIFWTAEKAEKWFEDTTGCKLGELYVDGECMNVDHENTKVYTMGTHVPPLDDNFEKPEGIVILPSWYTKVMRDKWIQGLKTKLGGIKLLVNQKLISQTGPPGFDTIYATNIAWIISWKPHENESGGAIERWQRQLPRDIGPALKAGAIDLRGATH